MDQKEALPVELCNKVSGKKWKREKTRTSAICKDGKKTKWEVRQTKLQAYRMTKGLEKELSQQKEDEKQVGIIFEHNLEKNRIDERKNAT
jgi:hypothetical protein